MRAVGAFATNARRSPSSASTTAAASSTVANQRCVASMPSTMLPPAATTIAMTVIQAISAMRLSFTSHPSTSRGQVVHRAGRAPPWKPRPVPTDLSPHNRRIALVRELLDPAGRREQQRFAAEGPTLLAEAERSGMQPVEVYAADKGLDGAGREVAENYERTGIPVYHVSDQAFARMSDVSTWSGLLGVFALPRHTAADVLAQPGAVLLLAGVNDPGNAGTLVRSAEAFGAAGVLFGRGGADPFGPKVVRAAMGSLFRLPVAAVEAEELLALAAASGRPVVRRGRRRARTSASWGYPRTRWSPSATNGAACEAGCRAGTGRCAFRSGQQPRV